MNRIKPRQLGLTSQQLYDIYRERYQKETVRLLKFLREDQVDFTEDMAEALGEHLGCPLDYSGPRLGNAESEELRYLGQDLLAKRRVYNLASLPEDFEELICRIYEYAKEPRFLSEKVSVLRRLKTSKKKLEALRKQGHKTWAANYLESLRKCKDNLRKASDEFEKVVSLLSLNGSPEDVSAFKRAEENLKMIKDDYRFFERKFRGHIVKGKVNLNEIGTSPEELSTLLV